MNESSESFFPRVLSGSTLKLLAVIIMLIDHVAAFLYRYAGWLSANVFTFHGKTFTAYKIMRYIGRSAFPLFCFLIVEGYLHTRSRLRYGIALFVAALIAEYPFDIVHGAFPYAKQNVFFTLLFGYLGICCYERFRDRRLLLALSVIGLLVLSYFFKADYGLTGYCVILLFYLCRTDSLVVGLIGTVVLGVFSFPAYILMAMYNGERGFVKGPVMKYAFYAFYPVHLMILYGIQLLLK